MIDVDDYILEHYGVKGMKWGVRNKKKVSNKNNKGTNKNSVKNASIVLGSIAAAAAIGIGAAYAKKHYDVKMSDVPKSKPLVENFASAMANEPVDIMYSSRGRDKGYAFLRDGSLENPSTEFVNSGLAEAGYESFKRYGDDNEKIAARFTDPLNRKDFAGRPIGHDVILPKSMTENVNNIDDVVEKTWPLIKDIFQGFYESQPGSYGPGY
jgi:hypothetical protein